MTDERNAYTRLLDLSYAVGCDQMRLSAALDEGREGWLRANTALHAGHLPQSLVEEFCTRVDDEVRLEDCIRSDVGPAIGEVLDARDEARAIIERGERPCTHAEHLTAAGKARCSAVGVAAAHQTLARPVEEQIASRVLDARAFHHAVSSIARSMLDVEGRRRLRANVRREIRQVEREVRGDILSQAHARRCRRDANLDRHRAPRGRARARGRRQRRAARRASGIRTGNDPGDGPSDPPGSQPYATSIAARAAHLQSVERLTAHARLRTSSPHPLSRRLRAAYATLADRARPGRPRRHR